MVVDIPYQSATAGKVDRLLQGLVGRCCGYHKAKNDVYIVSNFARIKAYADWIDGVEVPDQPSFRSYRKADNVKALVAKKSSAYVKTSEVELDDKELNSDEEPSDNEAEVDEKPQKVKKPKKKSKAELEDEEFEKEWNRRNLAE